MSKLNAKGVLKKFKGYIKEILPTFVLALISSFMLFLYEPVVLYMSNVNDFWFDMDILMSCIGIMFFALFFVIFLGYSFIYIIDKVILKKNKKIYNVCLIVGFVGFFVTYIQGNFMSGKLPVLDGTPIEWNNYTTLSVISGMLLVGVIGLTIFLVKKFKIEKCIKIYNYVSIAIFVMLTVSLLSTCMIKSDDLKQKKYNVTATIANINKYSNNKNFVIFMLDAIDSKTAEEVYQGNPEFHEVLKDFAYYPDTVGAYPFTRDSVPLVLSGVWSENKTDFNTFYNDAMDQSKLLSLLKEKQYEVNIYDDEFLYGREGAKQVKNLHFDNKIDKVKLMKQEIRYDMYKYLPYYLKRFSKIEYVDFKDTRKEENVENAFKWDDTVFCNEYINQNMEITENNQFKFIHLEGAHHPFDRDKDLNKIENGTYEDKIAASFTTVKKYIEYLKANGRYDNTAIIIMADHGFWFDTDEKSLLKRQNPIFFVKGFNEVHDERQVSNEKMSFDYLQDLYAALLAEKKNGELFENIDNSGPRRFLLYVISGYDHMVEYMQKGAANDFETLEATGNVYDR